MINLKANDKFEAKNKLNNKQEDKSPTCSKLGHLHANPPTNKLRNKLGILLHKPMARIKGMHLTLPILIQILNPPLPMKLKGFILGIQINNRTRRHIIL